MSYKQNVGFCRVLYYRPALFIAFYKMDTFVKHNFGLMICNFFNKVRFLTNKLKLLIFMKKPFCKGQNENSKREKRDETIVK